jgi:hypothetical protein
MMPPKEVDDLLADNVSGANGSADLFLRPQTAAPPTWL